MKSIVLLESIHQVMRAEKLLKAEGMKIDLIPVPREISSNCGIAIELPEGSEEDALRILENSRIPIQEWYLRGKKGDFQRRER